MNRLILASSSPRRQELLKLITTDFDICPAVGEETLPDNLPVKEAAQFLARQKALEVAHNHPDSIVLGADTTVVLHGEILGKPYINDCAAKMLRKLSGKTHQVITGVAVAKGKHVTSFQTETSVTFYPLTEPQIYAYVATKEPLDKAGAYGIQGFGSLLVREIVGDYYGVVGLPVAPTARLLAQLGY